MTTKSHNPMCTQFRICCYDCKVYSEISEFEELIQVVVPGQKIKDYKSEDFTPGFFHDLLRISAFIFRHSSHRITIVPIFNFVVGVCRKKGEDELWTEQVLDENLGENR